MSERLAPLDDQIELRGLLGAGGMGEVQRGWDRRLERAVAVKLVHSRDARDAERVLLEARLQARVEHPHVVKVHAVGSLEGRPCIVFQLVEGRTLADIAPRLSVEQRVELVRQAALGLHAAHLQGLVHRDVKPANVLVEESREGGFTALLTDFGLARGEEAEPSRSGLPAGTLDYMSPEQLVAPGPPDFRSDVYALGATLYSVLAGRPPFRRSGSPGTPSTDAEPEMDLLRRILEEDPEPLTRAVPGLPRELAVITARAMEKDPTARYPSAEALSDDLGRLQRGEPIHARPASWGERALKWTRRNRPLARAIAAVALILAVTVGWTAWQQRRADRAAVDAARLGALSESLEDQLRMEYLGPPHDLRPALSRLRKEAEQLRPPSAGGDGAVNAALGKALQLTGDTDGARAAYERAWRAGFRTPRLAEGLGEVLGVVYRRRYERARETLAPEAREPVLAALRTELAEPAKTYLRLGESTGWRASELAAREAMVERNFPEARARAADATAAAPGRYEASLLAADAWTAEARDLSYARRFDEAEKALIAAGALLDQAAQWGRSDPAVGLARAEIHTVRGNVLVIRGRSPDPEIASALTALDEVTRLNPDDPSPLVRRGFALIMRAQFQFMADHSAVERTTEDAIGSYRRAIELGADDARTLSLLGQGLYYRAFWANEQGRPSLEPVREGLAIMARAEKLAPEDSEVPFVLTLLHATEADALQHEGKPTMEARRAAIATGERALQMHAGRGNLLRSIVAQQRMFLGKDAWIAGEDPRPHFSAGWKAFEEAIQVMPGQPAPLAQFGNAVDTEAGILQALGENPCPKLQDLAARLDELLKKSPGLGYIEGIEAELLADAASYLSERGADPTGLLERIFPMLDHAEAAAPQDVGLVVSRSIGWLSEARWRMSHGSDPEALLARAEKHIGTLGPRTSEDLPQEYLARIALARAYWLTRNGKPASAVATGGTARVRKALESRPRDPDLWVLRAQLEALGGDPTAARSSLERAWSINPLIKGGPASHAAEALLATR
ncbi:MAG TPA: serine/threonine-protein kinase [Myxococcaceae bacterium]|nr:serine/threonine-protein kinase [Myxococcaceae bacterium]